MYDFETRNPKENVIHPFLKDSGVSDPSLIPYSVAEMRFDIAPEIRKGMHNCVDACNFGYAGPGDSYYEAVVGWMKKRHNWDIKPEWISNTYGIVSALANCVKAYTEEGDGVLLQSPVYPPFSGVVGGNNRKTLANKLIRVGDTYEIDFDDFEAKAREAKLFLLCSPHNPVGRVWRCEELERMARICMDNNVIIVADEIHNDLIMPGYEHIVTANIIPGLEDMCVVCTAPSKTFNIAGLATSNIIIKNPELKAKFDSLCGHFLNVPGLAACEAAYNDAAGWLDEALDYINENRRYTESFIHEKLPMIKTTKLEGTYLMWLDMSALGLDKDSLHKMLREEAQLFVNDGESFGPGGEGFIRFNIACPRRYVEAALDRLEKAINK